MQSNLTTTQTTPPAPAQKVEQLTAVVRDAEQVVQRAQELYDREPTRVHLENLREAKSELRLAQKELARLSGPRFELGRIIVTPGALAALDAAGQASAEFLSRHQRGDWGEVYVADKQENEFALKYGFRLAASYQTAKGEELMIVTEADRSATTILLPEEY